MPAAPPTRCSLPGRWPAPPLLAALLLACSAELPAELPEDTSAFVDDDARIAVSISPSPATTVDDLTATAPGTTDPSFSWTLDGEATPHAGAVIPSDDTTKGQRWRVFVTASEGTGTANLTVADTPPVVLSGRVGPDVIPGTPRDTVEVGMRAEVVGISTFDADGDTVTVAVTWRVDGDEVYIGAVWPSVAAPVGAEITALLRPIADGTEGAGFVTGAVAVIPAGDEPGDTDPDPGDTDEADTDASSP